MRPAGCLIVCVMMMACVSASAVKTRTSSLSEAEVDADLTRTMQELSSQTGLVQHINHVAAEMRVDLHRKSKSRARAGSKTKLYLCKTIFVTDAATIPYSSTFLNSKFGQWIPSKSTAVSLYMDGEASAKAFVGVSAGVGMGVDLIVDVAGTTRKATGQVRLFACLGLSFPVGFLGAEASAGGGVLVGFGAFKDSIAKFNTEVGVEVEALGAGSVGLLLNFEGGTKKFKSVWDAYAAKSLGAPAKTTDYATKAFNFCKNAAKNGLAVLRATVMGVHVFAGVGVGGGTSVSGEMEVDVIVKGLKEAYGALWNTKAGAWLKNAAIWKGLKTTITVVGESKFGSAVKKIVSNTKRIIENILGFGKKAANEFFDLVPLTEAEAEGDGTKKPAAAANAKAPAKKPAAKPPAKKH